MNRIFSKPFTHTEKEIKELVHHKPIRIAQRLLREFGDQAEIMVIENFPAIKEKDDVLKFVRQQRKTFENRCWNKGYVRTY